MALTVTPTAAPRITSVGNAPLGVGGGTVPSAGYGFQPAVSGNGTVAIWGPNPAPKVQGMSTTAPAAPTGGGTATDGGANLSANHDLFNTSLNTILGAENNVGNTKAGDTRTSIMQYLDSLKAQQNALDNSTVQNYLAKQQGTQGVNEAVGRGIRSGGVILANKNAGNSSAAQAIADAYGQIGRQQLAGVGGQFAQSQNANDQAEQALMTDAASHIRDYPQTQTDIVNGIVNDAAQQLGSLNQTMTYLQAPDRVDVESKKQQVMNDTLSKLQGLDQLLSNGVSANKPIDSLAAQQKAAQLYSQGVAPAAGAYDLTASPTPTFQNSGPAPSQLPIFTSPNNKNQNQPLPV